MPVTTWMARSVIEALPKTYHQPVGPAAPLGMGWVKLGSRLSRKLNRASSQSPTDLNQRLIVGPFPGVRPMGLRSPPGTWDPALRRSLQGVLQGRVVRCLDL